MYDIRLKENFKLFLSGPSRCGKTFFVADLLQNLPTISKDPASFVIYVYKSWQWKFDEMKHLVHVFIEDDEKVVENIKTYATGKSVLVVFDDMINSKSLSTLAPLFTVHGRHMNMSLVFLTQRMFVNDEYFRQISGNCDYFCVFKNPRKVNEIRELAKQLTPGSLELLNIYAMATKEPYSYLFINLTQECPESLKYTSHLFDYDHYIKIYLEKTT